MEYPNDQQVAEAYAESRRRGETPEEFQGRLEGMIRWTDEELAAAGVNITERTPAPPPVAFPPVTLQRRRREGWSADKQRAFIAALAETGCVSEACAEVGITPRSAYRLRLHPRGAAFRTAWDHAQHLAATRLAAVAWERAVHGASERLYKDGELVAERRKPSDRLLMWLLAHHNPSTYGWAAKPPGHAPDMSFFPHHHARTELPVHVANIADIEADDCEAECLVTDDFDHDQGIARA